MMEDKDNRDTHRLAFADWLDEQGVPDKAEHFRSPGWWGDTTAWSAKLRGGGTQHVPLRWVGWNWILPKPEWLESERCEALVRAWLRNGILVDPKYWWTEGVLARIRKKDRAVTGTSQ